MPTIPTPTGISPKVISLPFRNCGRGVHPDTLTRWSKHYADSGHTPVAPPEQSFGSARTESSSRGEDGWPFTFMDTTTRFVLSRDVAAEKMAYDTTGLLKAVRNTAGFRPRIFATGGPHAHAMAFREVFRSCRGLRPVHIRDSRWLKKFCGNSGHEWLNGELADILDRISGIRNHACSNL